MSSNPNTPVEVTHVTEAGLPRWVTLLFVVAFALVGYLLYAGYAARQNFHKGLDDADRKFQALAAEVDKTNSRLADLKGQLEVTSQKLGLTQDELARARSLAQSIKKDQLKSDAQLKEQIGEVQADTTTKFGQVATELNGTKSDVAATKADLETTKTKLQSTIGDLGVQSGLIARNHDEKDKTVGEPIQFYVRGARAPYEIVVFDLTKDTAKGYLSTPKSARAAPPSAPAGAPSSAPSSTPPGN